MTKPISRRTALRGVGVAVALPWMEVMTPHRSIHAGQGDAPVRLIWLHTESGMWMLDYKPTETGVNFELTTTLQPLAKYKDRMSVLTGLFHANAFRRNPQTGRHVQDTVCHLTGADLGSTPGVAVRNSISVDQLAAQHVGEQTRIPSLSLSPTRSGYLSFSSSGTGIPMQWNPRELFSQLFSDSSPEAKKESTKRLRNRKSILDTVMESGGQLHRQASSNDRRKLDEYFTHLREVERRIGVTEHWLEQPPVSPPPGTSGPTDAPEGNRGAHIRLLLDMLVLALQTDQCRLAAMRIGFMDCRYPENGFADSYHHYTHSDGIKERERAMAGIDRLRIEHLAYFLDKLDAIQESGKSLLHNCVVHYGSGMGSWHESTDIANLVVGNGGGKIKSCGHVDFGGAPLSNLFKSMLQTVNVPAKSFADSTGIIEQIIA